MPQTYQISAREADLLRTSREAEGLLFADAASHNLKEGSVEADVVWIVRKTGAPVRLTAEWFQSDDGSRYGVIHADVENGLELGASEIQVCDAWFQNIDVLTIHHPHEDLILDAGFEFHSYRNEVFSVSVADPRNHKEKCLLIQGDKKHWLLGGMAVSRRRLTTENSRPN